MNQRVNKNNCEFLFLVFFLFSFNLCIGQEFNGLIKDKEENTSLPFVNIYFKGTSIGVTSDLDGKFSISKKRSIKSDSLIFSFMGYHTKTLSVNALNKNTVVFLKSEESQLKTVVLTAKELPYTEYLMRKIIRNKKNNNPANVKKVTFKEVSLLAVYLSNLDEDILSSRRFRNYKEAFIRDKDSMVMMPVLFSKEIFSHTINKNKNIKTNIFSEQKGTLEQLNSLIKTTINNKITQSVNFYDDNIDLLGRSFPSPISSNYKAYYRMILADSTFVNGVKHYQFEYYPKNEKNAVFDGSFWVDTNSYALTEIEASIPVEANVNFIKSLEIALKYKKVAGTYWMVSSQKTTTSFSFVSSKNKKNTSYFSVQKNQRFVDFNKSIVGITPTKSGLNSSVSGNSNALLLMDEVKLDAFEKKTLKGINQLKNNGFIKFVDRFGAMTLNGYYNLNTFDLGPYFDLYYKNGLEGSRFTIPLRTSKKMSKKFTVGGYLGYGNKDKKFKYGVNLKYLLPVDKRTVLTFDYFDDYKTITQNRYIKFIQENPYSSGGGNILSVFSSNDRLDYHLFRRKHFEFSVSYQNNQNSRLFFKPFYDSYEQNKFNPLIHNGIKIKGFKTIGLVTDLRYSKARNFDQQFFSRIYFGSTIPVYHLTVEVGSNQIVGSSDRFSGFYTRLNASVKKKFLLGTSFIKLYMNAGCIFGKVPYPLLNNPSGNQNIGLARFNYNLLNPISFTSDVFTNLHLSFNGGGVLFNKVPILSSLNLRESLSFKAFYGKLRNNNSQFFKLPEGLKTISNQPYMELGIGVSNIFKVLRIEYVKRINTGSFYDGISIKGAIRLRVEVSF